MKYYKATIMVGFSDDEIFDSHCDLTFAFPKELHNPKRNVYLISHEEYPVHPNNVERLKTGVFTKEGGI